VRHEQEKGGAPALAVEANAPGPFKRPWRSQP
jgi:hypothetical protein